MKKTIFIASALMLSLTNFAQNQQPKIVPKTDTVYIDLSKVKVIVMLDSAHSKQPVRILQVEPLAKLDLVIANKQYWYNMAKFFRTAKNGLYSIEEIESLTSVWMPYAQAFEQALQAQQRQQPNQ